MGRKWPWFNRHLSWALKDVYTKNHNYLKTWSGCQLIITLTYTTETIRTEISQKILRFAKGRHACLIWSFSTCPDKLVWRARDYQLFHCNSFDSPAVINLPFVPLFIPYSAKPATNISTSSKCGHAFLPKKLSENQSSHLLVMFWNPRAHIGRSKDICESHRLPTHKGSSIFSLETLEIKVISHRRVPTNA